MGPERNPELFKEFAASTVQELATAELTRQKAERVLDDLSEVLNARAIKSPVLDPTLLAKYCALARLTNDPMGVPGLDPFRTLDFDHNDMRLNAIAGPSHDSYIDSRSSLSVHTRALLILPLRDFDTSQSEVEIFGLNTFVQAQEMSDDLSALEASGFVLPEQFNDDGKTDQSNTGWITPNGKPISGRIDVLAVRHKTFGVIQFYGLAISNQILHPSPQGFTRESDNKVVIDIPNGICVSVSRLTDKHLDQAIGEFDLAWRAAIDDPSQLGEQERLALRNLAQGPGVSPYTT